MKVNKYMSALGGTAVLLVASFSTYAIAQDSPWPMFRHDLRHTGYTPYTGPATPTVAWTFPAADGVVSSPTISANGTVYVGAGWHFLGADDHNLYALNPDGSLKWSYPGTDGFFASAALGSNDTVYISSLDGYLYAIQDMGGHAELKWRTYLGHVFSLSSPAVGDDGTVYVGSPSFEFFAVDPADGSIKWSASTGWCIISSPAIGDDGIIYVGSKDHHLYAFDDALEGYVWRFPTGTFYDGHLVDSSPAIGADGTIYVGTDPYGAAGQDPVPTATNFWANSEYMNLKNTEQILSLQWYCRNTLKMEPIMLDGQPSYIFVIPSTSIKLRNKAQSGSIGELISDMSGLGKITKSIPYILGRYEMMVFI